MSCPCNLSQEKIIQLKDVVRLDGGFCQHPRADGSSGVCGRALGAHPSEQGKIYCYYLYLVEI